MLEKLKKESMITLTENGAVTHSGTGSDCLDLFAQAGALRSAGESRITALFIRAYNEDPDAAMKLLFFCRDVRGGLGERRLFRICLRHLAENHPESVRKNLESIAEFGRYDDLLALLHTPVEADTIALIRGTLDADIASAAADGKVSLLAKWLPSVNASDPKTTADAKHIAKALGLTYEQYRKTLSMLRRRIAIIENDLRERDYTFDYEKQPSRALFKYREAFRRNDGERYSAFLRASLGGAARLHADNVAPYELVQPYLCEAAFRRKLSIGADERLSLNATWEALPDYGGSCDMLAVIDGSGSMYFPQRNNAPLPAAVALSLGLYFAERNRGAFRGHFITFSNRPRLIELKGKTFSDRLQYAVSFNEAANTDIDAVFELILRTAVRNGLPQSELPKKLVIISDMEFDRCAEHASLSNFENAKERFAEFGYELPEIVFWNAASRHGHQPVTMNKCGVTLVSGVTPMLFELIAGGSLTPLAFMYEVLGRERYAKICA